LCAILPIAGCIDGVQVGDSGGEDPTAGSIALAYQNKFDQTGLGYTSTTQETVPVVWDGTASPGAEGGEVSFHAEEEATGVLVEGWSTSLNGGGTTVPNLALGGWNVSLTVNGMLIGTCTGTVSAGQTLSLTFTTLDDATFGGCF
jgi:hypothetical protein